MQSKSSQVLLLLLSLLGLLTELTTQQCTNSVDLSPAISEYNATSTSVLTLYCAANSPPTDISAYFWQQNGVNLNYPANKYVIGGFTASDGGVYTCGVQFCGMLFYSKPIVINTAPSITLPPSSLTLYEGQSLQLSCAAAGWPTPLITWTKDGSLLGTAAASGSSTYLKQWVIITDGGTYTCTAVNKLGSVTAVAYAVVLALPIATSSTPIGPSSPNGPAMTSLGTATTTQPFSTTITSSVASSPVLTAPIKPSSTSVLQHSVQIASTTQAGSTHVLNTSSQLSVSATSSSLLFNASRGTSQHSTTLVLSATPLVLSSTPLVLSATPLVLSATPLVLSSTPLVLPAASSALNGAGEQAGMEVPYGGASFMLAVAAALFAALVISSIVTLSACFYYGRKIRRQRRNRNTATDKAQLVADMEGGKLETEKAPIDGSASQADNSTTATFGHISGTQDQLDEGHDQRNAASSSDEANLIESGVQRSVATGPSEVSKSTTKATKQRTSEKAGPSETHRPAGPSEVRRSTKATDQKGSERAGPSEVRRSTKTTDQKASERAGPSEVRRSTKTTDQKASGPSEVRRSTKTTDQKASERAGPSEVRRSTKTTDQKASGPSEVRRSTKTTEQKEAGSSDVDRSKVPSEVHKSTKTRDSAKAGPSGVQRPAGPSEVHIASVTTEQHAAEAAKPAMVQKSSASTQEKARTSEVRRSAAASGVRETAKASETQISNVTTEQQVAGPSGVRKSSVIKAGPSGARKSSLTAEQQQAWSAEVRKSTVTFTDMDDSVGLKGKDSDMLPLVGTGDLAAVAVFEDNSGSVPMVTRDDQRSRTTAAIEAPAKDMGRSRKLKLNINDSDKTTLIGAGDLEENGEEAGEVEPSVNEGGADISVMSVFVEKAKKMGRSVAYVKRMSRSHAMNVQELDGLLIRADEAITNNKESENPIVQEFNSVPVNAFLDEQLPPSIVAKNRYSNILPNPYSAVTLTSSGQEGSTYINANYIQGLNGSPEKCFIMTQGPIQHTLADFWRMVWENNVPAIVMLTKLVENDKEKCTRYWPEASSVDPIVYGQYSVRNNFEQVEAFYTISYLTVMTEQNGVARERDVVHLWYTAWPDFGIPKECSTILDYHRTVSAYLNPREGPAIVHCSAGIGRSGTFIAIHMGIEEFKETKTVDPLKYLCNIRQDRGGAIQTWEQYLFVHRVLDEYMYLASS